MSDTLPLITRLFFYSTFRPAKIIRSTGTKSSGTRRRRVPDNFVLVDLGPIDVHFLIPKSVIGYTEKDAKSIEEM